MREIRFYDKNIKPIPVTDEQFENLRRVYGKGGVIEVNGNLIDTKSIEGIFTTESIRHDSSNGYVFQNRYRPTALPDIVNSLKRQAVPRTPKEAREYVRKKVAEAKEKKK